MLRLAADPKRWIISVTAPLSASSALSPAWPSINAALFLEHFVPEQQDWLHIDLFAWNDAARPGRPFGGEAQNLCTLLAYPEKRFR